MSSDSVRTPLMKSCLVSSKFVLPGVLCSDRIVLLKFCLPNRSMSSLSSAINSLSAASVEDFFNRKKQLTDAQYMRYSKYAALFWGVSCIVLAFFTGDIAKTVIEAINKIGSVFYGPILATFIAAIGIKRINGAGINIGIVAGVGINIYLWLFVPEVFWFWWNAVGAVVTLVTAILGSFVFKKKEVSSEQDSMTFSFEIDRPKAIILVGFFILIIVFSVIFPSLI